MVSNFAFYKLKDKRFQSRMNYFLVVLGLLIMSSCIEIPLHQGPRCMIVTATFEPIKLEIKFPKIPNKIQGERFKVRLVEYLTEDQIMTENFEQDFLYRTNLKLQPDRLYHLCMQVIQMRSHFKADEEIYVNYIATEDFETLIGRIQIPAQLAGQENLQAIYKNAKQLTNLNKNILQNQKKERELEDKLVTENIHKNKRIYSLTLIECIVIILSGVYQVFALRRFLIEKNLY